MATDLSKRLCQRCHQKRNIARDFYMHRKFVAGRGLDLWCKECVSEYVYNEESLRIYLAANYRVFQPQLWQTAVNTAVEQLQNDKEYQLSQPTQRQNMLDAAAVKIYLRRMNQKQYYKVADDAPTDWADIEGDSNGTPVESMKKTYNRKWHGYYTDAEIEYLDEYLEGLQRDYEIITTNHLDYAKKVAKASLMVDKCYAAIADGGDNAMKKYKDAKEIFDSLSQSAKFAEKTRSPNEVAGLGSFGELVKRMENQGFLQTKVEFEPDDVDKILEEFSHTIKSLNGVVE
jgi:hypothetical protein